MFSLATRLKQPIFLIRLHGVIGLALPNGMLTINSYGWFRVIVHRLINVSSNQHWENVFNPSTKTYVLTPKFIRTKGVDVIKTNIRLNKGPMLSNYSATTKKWSVTSTDPNRKGDSIYVNIRALCGKTGALTSESTYASTDGTILSTGTFYSRPESPTDVMTYHEMCFIKAEVMFRQGNSAGALTAYKEGIRAHMQAMNTKLKQYASSTNPGKKAMNDAVSKPLSAALPLLKHRATTMAKIMQQKFIALSFTQQIGTT